MECLVVFEGSDGEIRTHTIRSGPGNSLLLGFVQGYTVRASDGGQAFKVVEYFHNNQKALRIMKKHFNLGVTLH